MLFFIAFLNRCLNRISFVELSHTKAGGTYETQYIVVDMLTFGAKRALITLFGFSNVKLNV